MDKQIPKYDPNERKMIYVTTGDDPENFKFYVGKEKVGDTVVDDFYSTDTTENSTYLKEQAEHRIDQYFKTAGVPYRVDWVEMAYREKYEPHWFRDHDVHTVLKRSGFEPIRRGKDSDGTPLEFFEIDVETAKRAIKAVKENRCSIQSTKQIERKIELRPEQKAAVKMAKENFEKKKPQNVLWNAKMRFGKTLSAYQLIKDENYKKVLVMTHRPVVSDSWFDDFHKLEMDSAGYTYISKKDGEKIEHLMDVDKLICFASIQDLRGSEQAGGNQGYKNQEIFDTEWDLVIVDEAHEGTRTALSKKVSDLIFSGKTRKLELSGTPFNISDEYEENQVFTWDYVMEQKAKADWSKKHPDEENPYQQLPKMNMFTFDYKSNSLGEQKDGSFNFSEFFKVNEKGRFVHESEVKNFLSEITTPNEKSNYPFSTQEYRDKLKHTLWLLPSVAAATALKKLMMKDRIFGYDYEIVNAVDNGDGVASESDLNRVRQAIQSKKGKSITLTVRKLTTGVNVPEWTAVMFLNNTNSPMNYLQAAFRVQTPFSDKSGEKTNAYIFDFAPDRALKIMTEASQFKVAPGKLNSSEQREKIDELLNFLPVIGQTNNGMKPYSVEGLVKQLKKVYAEKAVRSGFEDSSLYNDELLKLDGLDIERFDNLKKIVGSTSGSAARNVKINGQGFSKEEYDAAEKGQKKSQQDRTPEEQAALEKLKKVKKQRTAAISILRGISIRIPLMIFGMDADIEEEISIDKFIEKVDDQSWNEFMPVGVTKERFREFTKYYDADVFISAGNIIRKRAQSYDSLPYIQRTQKLTQLFSTFKNPDKETVLTPWRVVNIQLGKSIGGLGFFNEEYSDVIEEPTWINNHFDKENWSSDRTYLEINSKTGLYPLYIVSSLLQRYVDGNKKATHKPVQDQQVQQILKNNIYVIAKTPMAKTITQRTLAGYTNWPTNIKYFSNLITELKNNFQSEVGIIRKAFNDMKFDVVVGNPPYQEDSGTSARDNAVYNYFYDLAKQLADKYVLITPARFLFNAGTTPKEWNKEMLEDEHLKCLMYEPDSSKVFPNTGIAGGVVIVYRDSTKKIGPIGHFTSFPELNQLIKEVKISSSDSLKISF